ncbi:MULTISPECIES: hypothetical protein [Desulfoluna]|uniref:Uncharacterized protein n=2 Tax=Desulfoluna TaxID=497721 RepID=A0A1G5AH30_9BACT|nr:MULTISPECIES: hypothetical protein [Desulfoluna]SCX77188.1 hypothetical protein SAMN05216233_101179 [Desulfoluna spongiiphila]VFQ42569.1 hypothetical protein MSL71_1900 [Desulfoluna butyratoxydans]VVS90593.1 hypothetical protein DBB_1600 [Desulfoluna spongiiphila]
MHNDIVFVQKSEAYLDCFGNFDINDKVCTKHCALCLKCIIERDQNDRMELIEDLMNTEAMPARLQ